MWKKTAGTSSGRFSLPCFSAPTGRDDVRLKLLRLGGRAIATDDPAIATDQELGEVPLDRGGAQEATFLPPQPLPQWISGRSIDIDPGGQRETHPVIKLAEGLDLLRIARFLVAELVAGKADHHQALFAVTLPQCLQPGVLRGEATTAGHIDQQQDLPPLLFQLLDAAVDVGPGVLPDRCHGVSGCRRCGDWTARPPSGQARSSGLFDWP